MGYDNRPPTEDELNEMKKLFVEAMKAGAFGYSSGLIYPPGSYGDTGELIELAKAMAPFGGVYVTICAMKTGLLKSVNGLLSAVKPECRFKYPTTRLLEDHGLGARLKFVKND